MRALLLESVAGVAGDMFTAAFVDAGLVDTEAVLEVPALLGLQGVEVVLSKREVAGVQATQLDVKLASTEVGKGSGAGTTYRGIDEMLAASRLPEPARRFARDVFLLLAEAEAQAHGVEIEGVHFHEVGAVDSIVDVALAGLCVATVAPDRVLATPVKLGRGTIRIRHGEYPVPAPAAARLSRGLRVAEVPEGITAANIELSTPTGLAILRALDPSFTDGWPAGEVVAQGMGRGTTDLGSYPNVFRVVLLDRHEAADESGGPERLPYLSDSVVEICCNIDDETPERVAWTAERLLDLGALDVWITPVTGKKGRIALLLSVLARLDQRDRLVDWILRQTSTFGVRHRRWERSKLERHIEVREMQGERIAFKIGRTTDGRTLKEKPEYEDLERIWKKE